MQKKTANYQTVWNVLQEYIEANKESDRQLKEQMKETERLLKEQALETDRRMKETDKQLDKTLKGIEKLEKTVGGIGNSNGFYAEDIFFNSFSKNMTIGNLTFDSIDRNMHRIRKGLEDEFDIVLTNSSILLIIEVKYNFHHNDVEKVLNKIDNFKKLYPGYNDYRIFGGIAGLTMARETIDKARQLGFFVFLQEGNDIKVLNDSVIAYGLE